MRAFAAFTFVLGVASVAMAEEPSGAPVPPETPASRCVRTRQPTACLSDGDVAHCLELCNEAIFDAEVARTNEEESACEERVVAANAKGAFACDLPRPSRAREAEASVVAAAKHAKSAPELVSAYERVLSVDAWRLIDDCNHNCNTKGRSRVQAPKAAPSLVRTFKQCMVRADSTREARKLALFERALYCDYRAKAEEKCREASRCDWLEEFSTMKCTYDTPDWNADYCPARSDD